MKWKHAGVAVAAAAIASAVPLGCVHPMPTFPPPGLTSPHPMPTFPPGLTSHPMPTFPPPGLTSHPMPTFPPGRK